MAVEKVALQGNNKINIDGIAEFTPSKVAEEFNINTQEIGLAKMLNAVEIGAGFYRDGRFSRGIPLTGAFLAKAEIAGIQFDCLPDDHPIRTLRHSSEKVREYLTILRNEYYGKGNCPYVMENEPSAP